MKTMNLVLGIMAAGVLVLATEARATVTTVINGSMWNSSQGITDSTLADAAHQPGVSPAVTFSVPNGALDFDSRNDSVNGYNVAGWLATGGATLSTGNGAQTMNDTFVHLSGTVSVTAGETFSVTQDDGLTLIIGGVTVLNHSGGQAPTQYTGTYAGATGNEPFDLYYTEIEGPPAVLQVDLPFVPQGVGVPDSGTTIALLGLGLAGLAGMARRVRAS